MPCHKRKHKQHRTSHSQMMKMTADVAKTAIGATATAYVVAKVTDALK